MAYRILFVSRAERSFKRLSADVQDRIISQVNSLAENPRPAGAVKLTGSDNLYRVRVGDYRIIYAVEDDLLVVLVVEVGHRREIYRKPDKRLTHQFLLSLIKDKIQ
ncbi:type II toxin-antitoxin system RelE family toxin [Desulfomonile tiedjei]|uniref:type II toxin-antitoxin system RelE family toxin n=1 Tax=Desulfomonile tiedjei TaxID=2358 RepID=UPI000694D25E